MPSRFYFCTLKNIRYVETKGPSECRDAVNNMFVKGPIGSMTYKETERGNATDHTNPSKTSFTSTKPAPNTNLTLHELIVLGHMPARGDFEVEFENEGETLVSGIHAASGSGSRVESEDEEVKVKMYVVDNDFLLSFQLETGLKLAQVEMYQNKLKERERRKQVARDFDLVETFFICYNV